jgi:hypothetical protein
MSVIGGYFELELSRGKSYHPDAIAVNTGRNAFEYIMLANHYTKVYIPRYTCAVLLEPLVRNHIPYEYYRIDRNFEPVFDFTRLEKQQAFLYTNYWGLKDNYVKKLARQCRNLIVDNAQAFYARPVKGASTFYSARKFFGVPDGAYLYTGKSLNLRLSKDSSDTRFLHLVQRIDRGAEEGYVTFLQNESLLHDLPVMEMSAITQKLLQTIDYKSIATKRRRNFRYLAEHLNRFNNTRLVLKAGQVPMAYPFLSGSSNLRDQLTACNIFTGKYWKEVNDIVTTDSIEYLFTNNLIALPIDQRQDLVDLDIIIKTIINGY